MADGGYRALAEVSQTEGDVATADVRPRWLIHYVGILCMFFVKCVLCVFSQMNVT